MLAMICFGLLLLTGFVTVLTEAFTHLLTRGSLWSTLREFLLESWLFTLTAFGWAGTVWLGLRWLGLQTSFLWVFEVLAFAHLPLLAYPLTIFPTIGYRLEQLLRLCVFATLALTLFWKCELTPQACLVLALPGYAAHFLFLELRLLRRGEAA